jgi:hypothetical protein
LKAKPLAFRRTAYPEYIHLDHRYLNILPTLQTKQSLPAIAMASTAKPKKTGMFANLGLNSMSRKNSSMALGQEGKRSKKGHKIGRTDSHVEVTGNDMAGGGDEEFVMIQPDQ